MAKLELRMGKRSVFTVGGAAGLSLGILLGALIGLGAYTFGYARGWSYISNDASACANCHVMNEQYAGWMKGSHGSVAVCNDCHTPEGTVPKYATKMMNGFFHSLAFTTGNFPDNIQITDFNHRVAEDACQKCHSEIVEGIESVRPHGAGVACVQCHANVGHE